MSSYAHNGFVLELEIHYLRQQLKKIVECGCDASTEMRTIAKQTLAQSDINIKISYEEEMNKFTNQPKTIL